MSLKDRMNELAENLDDEFRAELINMMNELAEGDELKEKIEATVQAVVDNFDFDDAISDAASEYDYSRHIERAVESYDFDSAIEDALGEYNIERAVKDAADEIDWEDRATDAIKDAVDQLEPEIVEKAVKHAKSVAEEVSLTAVDERLREILPEMVKNVILAFAKTGFIQLPRPSLLSRAWAWMKSWLPS